jgi:hypothetical protein
MILEITYPARCKDCIYIDSFRKGKVNRYVCMYGIDEKDKWNMRALGEPVGKRDFACKNFKLD